MTDQNTAIALELELSSRIEEICNRWDGTAMKDSAAAKGCAFQLSCLVANNRDTILAALRTPAPAPVAVAVAVGGDVVEGMAKAIYEEDDPWHTVWPWPNLKECGNSDTYRRLARAALQAQPTASTAQPDDVVGRVIEVMRDIAPRAYRYQFSDPARGTPVWRADSCPWNGQTPKATEALYSVEQIAPVSAALASMHQAPVADDVRELVTKVLTERAEYFDRTTGHFDRKDAARSYRATLADVLKALSTQPQPDAAAAVEQPWACKRDNCYGRDYCEPRFLCDYEPNPAIRAGGQP